MIPTFVPMNDEHLAASLKVGEAAWSVYTIGKQAGALAYPESVVNDLAIAHAALNRAACTLIDVAIRNNEPRRAVSHYTALAAQAMDDAA